MYKLIIKGNSIQTIYREVINNLGMDVAVKDIRQVPGWDESFVLIDTDLHVSIMFDKLNRWLTKDRFLDPPFPWGTLLWWHLNRENEGQPKEVMQVTVISADGTFPGVLMSDDSVRIERNDPCPDDEPEDDEIGDYDPDLVPEDLPF